MNKAIDEKINQKKVTVEKDNEIDQLIVNAFTKGYLLGIMNASQWCGILVDHILLPDDLRLLMEQL